MPKIFLAGDVMTGRGIDQILPHPGDPSLFEAHVTSALGYVALAENAHGAIERPAAYSRVWGDSLDALAMHNPDVKVVNLETAITDRGAPEPKGINYRMHPANVAVLQAAGIDCCTLANNHVLDWGEPGLLDTLSTLKGAGILSTGAGRSLAEASQPAAIEIAGGGAILVFGMGVRDSGIPPHWAAGKDRAGVRLLPDLSARTAGKLASEIGARRRAGDIVIVSVHWGSNWGYAIPPSYRDFAHALIDLGACDILHGHSSHHARAIEVYRGKPILYGCGDFIDDYEGIRGYEEFRGDLSPMYLASVSDTDGTLEALTVELFQMRRFRLCRASLRDVKWFETNMNRHSQELGVCLSAERGGALRVAWGNAKG